MNEQNSIAAARKVLHDALIYLNGEAVGCVAARDPNLVADNYAECFIRDFIPCALVYLAEGDYAVVRRFLTTAHTIRNQQIVMSGHDRSEGLMPASFRIDSSTDQQQIIADFGERAIGRVAPVDSAMWWMILLSVYVKCSGDTSFAQAESVQQSIHSILSLYLQESFETSPAMLVPDAGFMIDRRMGVYGHPLEIQSLLFGMLQSATQLLLPTEQNKDLIAVVIKRSQALRSYVRIFYWLDLKRLNEIHRFRSEEFGLEANNLLNIYPESIPQWLDGWIPTNGGYFVGNLGPGRLDFRFFSLGNLLAIKFGLATEEQAMNILNLYDQQWQNLMGKMPVKICYPAIDGQEWALLTGCDPKNVAWSYHNGGNWPCLLWVFIAAALRVNCRSLARKAFDFSLQSVESDQWPEYYDGRSGSLIGRRANLNQTWTAAAVVLGKYLLDGEKNGSAVLDAMSSLGNPIAQ